MKSLLVVGSVAYDSVTTGSGSRKNALGGSAMYFSVSSSFFSEVSLVAVVGEDFSSNDRAFLSGRGIDLTGLEIADGKTFRWEGVYDPTNVNYRETIDTQLNVFGDFCPKLSNSHRKNDFLFLANIDPTLQLQVLKQMSPRPKLVALDTMDFWIADHREELAKTIENVDVLFMDEDEVKSFTGEENVMRAANTARDMGPRILVVKKGEHGVLLFNEGDVFAAPAFPLANVIDPTGAGDSFAGGFMGYLANEGDLSAEGFRRASIVGSVMGAFAVEGFSAERFQSLKHEEINERFRGIAGMTAFKPLDNDEKLPKRSRA